MADTHVFFVADGDRLEWQSWLLATSLAQAHKGQGDMHFYAYAGAEWWPKISPVTKSIYEQTGVELRQLATPPNWAKPYPHGNKIVAATDKRGSGRSIFLDTDMVCMKPLNDFGELPDTHVAVAPEGKPTWGADSDRWERAYTHFNLPVPTERIRMLRGRRQEFYPYFNAGFVGFAETPGEDGKTFADHWLETALDFDHNCKIGSKRPWLDQITLPLTMARFGYQAHILTESHNYSLSNRLDYTQTPDAHILHYHRCRFLQQAPQWLQVLEGFFEIVPQSDHNAAREGLVNLGIEL